MLQDDKVSSSDDLLLLRHSAAWPDYHAYLTRLPSASMRHTGTLVWGQQVTGSKHVLAVPVLAAGVADHHATWVILSVCMAENDGHCRCGISQMMMTIPTDSGWGCLTAVILKWKWFTNEILLTLYCQILTFKGVTREIFWPLAYCEYRCVSAGAVHDVSESDEMMFMG